MVAGARNIVSFHSWYLQPFNTDTSISTSLFEIFKFNYLVTANLRFETVLRIHLHKLLAKYNQLLKNLSFKV